MPGDAPAKAPPRKVQRRGSKKTSGKRRPEFWSPDWYLAWRRGNPGVPILAQYRIWAEQWNTSVDSIKAELRIWKVTEPGFAEKLAGIAPGAVFPEKSHGSTDDHVGNWRQRFCGFYRVHHNRKQAAEEAGVPWETIRKKLDKRPGNAVFDEEFWNLVKEIEAETLEDARAGLKTAFALARDQEDPRTLGKLSIDVLERREPDEWARNQRVQVGGTIFHAPLGERQSALSEALSVSRRAVVSVEAVRALPAHPQAAEVIDVELLPDEPDPLAAKREDVADLRRRVEEVLGSAGVAALEGAIAEAMDRALPVIRDSMDAAGSISTGKIN